MTDRLNRELQELKDSIESEVLNDERIVNNEEAVSLAVNILEKASWFIENVNNKDELLFMYNTLSNRLYEAGMVCNKMRNPSLARGLILISRVIREVLYDKVLFSPRNVNNKILISRIWPHNCGNVKILKNVIREYIIENAVLLNCYGELVTDFLIRFDMEISNVYDLNSLRDLYEKIQYEAEQTAKEFFVRGFYEEACQYGVIELVIKYMFSDFKHCFKGYDSYGTNDKQTYWPTDPLRFRRHRAMQYQLNKPIIKNLNKSYSTMESVLQKVREELENEISQRIEQEFEGKAVERAYEVLIEAETILKEARTERELIAIYDMIAERLKDVSYAYKDKSGFMLWRILYRLGEIIHETIKAYLPHRVYSQNL